MAYTLFDFDGQDVTHQDLQARSAWYEFGLSKEDAFVTKYGEKFGVRINPEKVTNPAVPDLVQGNALAELKCQNTPYFYAEKDGITVDFAFTMNVKDVYRYGRWGENYPGLNIYFWIDHIVTKMVTRRGDASREYRAEPGSRIWVASFADLEQRRRTSPMIGYQQRRVVFENDAVRRQTLIEFDPRLKTTNGVIALWANGNASGSYVFDLREDIFRKLL